MYGRTNLVILPVWSSSLRIPVPKRLRSLDDQSLEAICRRHSSCKEGGIMGGETEQPIDCSVALEGYLWLEKMLDGEYQQSLHVM